MRGRFFYTTALTLFMLFAFNGCVVHSPHNSDVGTQIDRALQESVFANSRIDARKNGSPMTNNLSKALMPQVGLKVPNKVNPQDLEHRFDVAVNGVPAKSFFLGLVKGTKYNITVSPKIAGRISLDLKGVTVEEALEAVEDLYGYEYEKTPYGFHVMPRQLQTKMFTLNYLNIDRSGKSNTTISSGQITRTVNSSYTRSSVQQNVTPSSSVETDSKADFWRELKESLLLLVGSKDGRSVVVNPNSGLVIVKAYPNELMRVSKYLDSVQNIAEREVIIEAKILEVALSADFQAGIDWNILGLRQTGNKRISNDIDFSEGVFGNIFTLDAHDGGAFGTVIKMLNSQGRVNVLSSPRIAALNNEKAVIKVGEDEFFVTNVSSNTAVGGLSGATDVAQDIDLTPFFSGIALDVTPQIDDDGNVTLHIHPIVSEVEEQIKDIKIGKDEQKLPLAKSSIRESDNVVRAKNGQVIVIGGLMENISKDYSAGSPGADKLPAIGGLLKDTNRSARKMELVILLKPTVIGHNTWRNKLRELAKSFRTNPREFKYVMKKKPRRI